MRKPLLPALVCALALGACADNGDDAELGIGEDTTAAAAADLENPPAGAIDVGQPVLVSEFQAMEADTADTVTGTVRIYADAGPAEAMAGEDAPARADSLMDAGPAADPGTARETPGVEAPMAGTGGGFRLALVMDGLSPGSHAWHIHGGPCGRQAPVVVPFTETAQSRGIAQPLTADAAGTARAVVTVPPNQLTLEQLRAGEYSLHVHIRGGVDHGPTVACAEL